VYVAAQLDQTDRSHKKFDSTKGYPGEGPGVQTDGKNKREVGVIGASGGRELDLGAPSDDDCASALSSVSNCAPAADNASLWTGDNMAEIGAEGAQFNPMTGTINFFNIDGIKFGADSVAQVIRENMKTNCMVSSIDRGSPV
jgi:hypothetical protein